MLNRDGIKKTVYGAPVQILDNVELQASVGCIVDAAAATDGKVLAGTPIVLDLSNLQTPATKASGDGNAVLLHDVEIQDGKTGANATALIFGFVNWNRCDSTVQALLTPGVNAVGNVTVIKH